MSSADDGDVSRSPTNSRPAQRDLEDQAIYVISVAAELAGVHPQTLRVYERKGLLTPQRTSGNTRRYSERDIQLLRRIQELTQEGVNLAGVMKILELEIELDRLRSRHKRTLKDLEELSGRLDKIAENRDRMALVPFKDIRRIRRAMKSDAIEQSGRRRMFPSPPVAPR